MHCESGAGTRRALDVQSAAVPVKHVLDEGQAQAGSALGAAIGDIDPVEPLGQPRQMLGRDTGTVIAYRQARLRRAGAALAARQRNIDPLYRRRRI